MQTEVLGTVENGVLMLDSALPFADHTRVKIIVQPVEPDNARLAAWERMLALFDANPITGDGKPFNREELYDRD